MKYLVQLLGAALLLKTGDASEREPLEVISAGLGRFGTTSLCQALDRLGYKTTHGTATAKDLLGAHAKIGTALMEGNVDDLLKETSAMGYNATTTSHNIFWKEMMEKTPKATVIFMFRDFESWFESLSFLLTQLLPLQRYPLRAIPFFDSLARYTWELTLRTFEADYEIFQIQEIMRNPAGDLSRSAYKNIHNKFVSDMDKTLKEEPDRSFLFDKKDGYPSLCRILSISEKDCPSEEVFPHAHKAADIGRQGRFFRILEGSIITAPLLIVLVILRSFRRGLGKSKVE